MSRRHYILGFGGAMRPNSRYVTPTRRSWLHCAARMVRIAWLRFEINSAERWIADCAREGIYESESLLHLARQVEALRVRLAVAEAS